MKPIKVMLCHRNNWYRGEPRIDGGFSYPVPQFEVYHTVLPKTFAVHLKEFVDMGIDIVWWDEGKHAPHSVFLPGRSLRDGFPPVVQHVLYPTLTTGHYRSRMDRAKENADLVSLDHDDLARWGKHELGNIPARRCAYSVNERFYRDRGRERDIDVGFYCVQAYNSSRQALDNWLESVCRRKGWRYHSIKDSVGVAYADLLARTKVVVHQNRTRLTRPPRIFDCGATRTALLSNPMPGVSGEHWMPWMHYAPFELPGPSAYEPYDPASVAKYEDWECDQVLFGLEWLLEQDNWKVVAEQAHQYVLSCHTWAQRAVELYGIFLDVFPHLRVGREEWWYGGGSVDLS